uniref:Sulfotransferase n=1 Tax=Phallusia mammillata TaxID=59560 RepID=A0A6F9DFD5_9ASCI|nr:heparan sulfate glucosamine 3-O-sulfotransferase 3B1-like [Phallusia mammillata]
MRRKIVGAIITVSAITFAILGYSNMGYTVKSSNPVIKVAVDGCLRTPTSTMLGYSPTRKGVRKRLPHIIGIGSKKCGTGAFRHFLRFHSKVQVSLCEPHFFDDSYNKGTEYYKSLLPWSNTSEYTFEKTPKYIVTGGVPKRIISTYEKEGLPTPKFVLVVCDPVQRAFSDFSKAKRNTGYKTGVVGQFQNFEEYVEYALNKIRTLAPPVTEGVHAFYSHMKELESKIELRFLTRGIYSYFLENWYQYFPRKDFVIVDGDRLLTEPGEVMVKAQEQLGLEVEIGPENFIFNREKGFYCIKYNNTNTSCLSPAKGRTRTVKNGTVLQPKLSKETRRRLDEFYRPFLERFTHVTSAKANWVQRLLHIDPSR